MAPTEDEAVADAGRRRAAFQEALEPAGARCAVVTSPSNFAYLTGYQTPSWANVARPIALVVPADGTPCAVISEGEADRIAAWDPGLEVRGYTEPSGSLDEPTGPGYAAAAVDLIAAAHPQAEGSTGGSVAIELSGPSLPGLPPAAVDALAERLSAALVDLDALIWPLRMLKTPFELQALRESAAALGRAFERFAGRIAPGMSERRLAAEFAVAAAEEEGCELSYVVVVAGAVRPALGPPTDRVWQPQELLTVDAGMVSGGYWADFCRHYAAVGSSPAQEDAYAGLVGALRAGRGSIAAGGTVAELADSVAGALRMGTGGFGRLGHGIGLDIAEPPSLHSADPNALRDGMALCVEPSARVEGVGHLVAEEMVAVGGDGAELLSPPFPDELEVIPA